MTDAAEAWWLEMAETEMAGWEHVAPAVQVDIRAVFQQVREQVECDGCGRVNKLHSIGGARQFRAWCPSCMKSWREGQFVMLLQAQGLMTA